MRAYRWYLGANDLDLPLASVAGRRLLRRADADRAQPKSGCRVDSGAATGHLRDFGAFKGSAKRGRDGSRRRVATLRGAAWTNRRAGLLVARSLHPSRCGCTPILRASWCGRSTSPGRPMAARRAAPSGWSREVLAMSPAARRATQLEVVLKDFEARHWQTRRVFMTRYDEIEDMLGLDGARDRRREAPADRRLFLPRIQLCRRRADEPQRGAAFRPVGHAARARCAS